MKAEPRYAPPLALQAPSLPPPRNPAPWIVAFATLINENALKVYFMLAVVAGAVVWLVASLFGWLVFSDTGGYVLIGLSALFALSRLALALLVFGGIAAVSFLDQSISSISTFLVQWWPLAISLAIAAPLTPLVERAFLRR